MPQATRRSLIRPTATRGHVTAGSDPHLKGCPLLPAFVLVKIALLAMVLGFSAQAQTGDTPPDSTVQSEPAPSEPAPANAAPADATSGDAASAPSQTLIDILQDDTARAALIAQLQQTVPASGADPDAGTAADAPADPTVAQSVVAVVTRVLESTGGIVETTLVEIRRVADLVRSLRVTDWTLSPDGLTLVMVIGAVILVSLCAKLALGRVIARNPVTALTPIRERGRLILLYGVLRVVSLIAALGAGYLVSVLRGSGNAGPSSTEAIFLTSVLTFGVCRIALRILVTPDAEHEPALSHLHPRAQEAVYRTLRGFVAALTFSFMFILPLVREWVGFSTVRPVRTLLVTLLLILAIMTLRRIVDKLDRARADARPDADGTGVMLSRGVQSAWRAIWPPLTTIYIIYCWLIAVTRPRELGDVVLGGTLYSIAAVLMALAGLWMMQVSTRMSLALPSPVDRVMPDLAMRISRLLRILVAMVSVVAILGALVTVLTAWNLISPERWLSDPAVQQIYWRLVSAALLACFLALIWAVIASFVDQRLRGAALIDNNRARTLLGLFRNAFTIFVAVLGAMVVLSQLGIDIAPLLAGAGVIGLAIGFGSQKLVQDIITGVFIQLENAINEGDVVGVAGITGSVEKLSIRSVRLRTLDGAVHIVPFSSVDTVTNLSRDFSYHLADMGVAYKEKVPNVIAAMQAAFDTLRAGVHGPDIIGDFEVHGVTALGDSSVTVRGRIKTRPGRQWALGRDYTALCKEEFEARGIEIPYPHQQILLPTALTDALSRAGRDSKPAET